MSELLSALKFREFSDNDASLAGGKLYSYEAGTTTPLATYQDEGLTTPHANPIILDGSGRAAIWLANEAYKFVLKDANDVTLYTIDDYKPTYVQLTELVTFNGALAVANNLSDLASASAARTNLGLGNVNNTSDANKPISTATQAALDLKASAASLTSHTGNTSNPHSVTPTQVGNTTAQWNANKLQDIDVDTTDPTDGQTLTYDQASGKWKPTTAAGTGDFKADGSVPMTAQFRADADYAVSTPEISKTGDTNTGMGFSAADTIDLITTGVSRFQVGPSGDFKSVVSSGSTLIPAFFLRAYADFDLTTLSVLAGTYSRTGTTVTVTATAHGHSVGHAVQLDFTSGTATDGEFVITSVPDANTFTVTHGTSGSTSGNVNLNRLAINSSCKGNVHTVYRTATGVAVVNFITPMPDTGYLLMANTQGVGTGGRPMGGDAESVWYCRTRSLDSTFGLNNNGLNRVLIFR